MSGSVQWGEEALLLQEPTYSAQWYNPSALTRIQGSHFQIDLMGVKQEMYFDRQDYPGNGPKVDGNPTDLITDPIRNGAPFQFRTLVSFTTLGIRI